MSSTGLKWNPAPGWPEAPEGWVPSESWSPDPSWPPAPVGWQFWLPEVPADLSPAEPTAMPMDDHPKVSEPVAPVSIPGLTQEQQALPGIESYPGFVTRATVNRSRWFGKSAIGMAAGVAGLIIGLASAGDADAAKDEAEKDAQVKIARIQDQIDERLDEAKQQALVDEQETIDDAVATAVAEEKTRQAALTKKAVAAAVKETKADLKVSTQPKTLVSANDPRFDTCGAANVAGYGNYRKGSDPEYDWYDDRDNDGFVCE
jgi:hypothetical protein